MTVKETLVLVALSLFPQAVPGGGRNNLHFTESDTAFYFEAVKYHIGNNADNKARCLREGCS